MLNTIASLIIKGLSAPHGQVSYLVPNNTGHGLAALASSTPGSFSRAFFLKLLQQQGEVGLQKLCAESVEVSWCLLDFVLRQIKAP